MPTDEQGRLMAIRRQQALVSPSQLPFVRQPITGFTAPPTAQPVYVSQPGTPGPSIVPMFSFYIDPADGTLKLRANVSDGLGYGGSLASSPGIPHPHEPNSTPRIASLSENNGFVLGGNHPRDLNVKPDLNFIAAKTGSGINFLQLDPNPDLKPGGDTKGARGNGPALFPG